MSVKMTGMDGVKSALAAAAKICSNEHVLRVCETPLKLGLLDVLRVAAQKGAIPRAKGTLARSGKVRIRPKQGSLTGAVEYGGMASKYAGLQHDRDDFRHTLLPGQSRTHKLNGKPRKRPLRGYQGGHAHWLYGNNLSAWERRREAVRRRLQNAIRNDAQHTLKES